MTPRHFATLLLLAAIWGAAFLFLRIAAPVLGPAVLSVTRMLIAAIFLTGVAWALGKGRPQRKDWRHYLILGGLSSALPFLLFGYAATRLPASMLAILNSTAPFWGALIAAWLTRSLPSGRKLMGLLLGVSGVGLLIGFDPSVIHAGTGLAIASALLAALSYAVATHYMKTERGIEPYTNAQGNAWAATVLLAPTVFAFPAPGTPSALVLGATLTLGILCSGVAYLMYFRLIAQIGAASSLTVAFLIPMFGVLWGTLLLDEAIGWHTLLGMTSILVGTALVTGLSLRKIRAV